MQDSCPRFRLARLLQVCALLLAPLLGQAKGLYLTQEEFLQQVFGDTVPEAQTVWLRGDTKAVLQKIFDRKTVGLRQRYWRDGQRSAWIMNEIGKDMPITMGIVVNNTGIEKVVVLEYRESRGGEIRHGFFTRQFEGAGLKREDKLDTRIDGITGATLSVRAMTRVATAALYLHQQTAASE